MQIIVDGLFTNYQQTGKGKLVLMLHGWGDDLRTFQILQNNLSIDFEVVAIDLPGFGESQAPTQNWDLHDYAQFVAHFLDKKHLSHPYAIIGHSNGGALAIVGISTNILKAQKLILLAASGIRDTKKTKRVTIKIIAKTGKMVTFWLPPKTRSRLQKALYGVVGSDMMVTPELKETFKKTVRQDTQHDAAQLDLPVLLIYGTSDKATPVSYGDRYISLMKNASLIKIEGKGHFIHQEASGEVLKEIKDFMAA